MRPITAVAMLLLLSTSSLQAANVRRMKKAQGVGLWDRVSAWLNADEVIKAQPVAAVAAVRGGIPKDQGEDLDQRLLDRAALLRRRLLSGSPSEDDRAALRPIYDALALSQFAQAIELQDAQTSQEARAEAKAWRARRRASLSTELDAALAKPDGLGGDALVKAGWGPYCRTLTAGQPEDAQPQPELAVDAQTAKLDELLKGVQDALTGKALAKPDRAQAHLLAGKILAQLVKAPLAPRRVATSGSSSARAASGKTLPPVARRAPEAAAEEPSKPQPDFAPRSIYDRAAPSVVLIMCSGTDGAGELGSGSFVAPGRVLTNAHVVIRDSTGQPWPRVRVYLKPARMTGDPKRDLADPITARVLAWDVKLDLAALEVEGADRPVLPLAGADTVAVGDRVAAIGHPEQGGLWTLTTGIISTVVAELGGVHGKAAYQTDASINRGNSGGPLLDAAGEIVGVNTLMSRKAADGLAITSVNFAVRSDIARNWLSGAGIQAATEPPAAPPPPAQPEKIVVKAAPPPATPVSSAQPVKAPKEVMVTESKPFKQDDLIAREIKSLEELGEEMDREIQSYKNKK